MNALKKHILVAEDDEQISYLLSFLLNREGYAVTVANDGQEALDYIQENPPADLAIFDVMMPYVNGNDLTREIRQNKTWQETPIIILTAKSLEKDIVHALEGGANDYMIKPFQPGELVARIKKHIAIQR